MPETLANDWTHRLALPPELGLLSRIMRATMLVGQSLETITAQHGVALGDYLVLGFVRRSGRAGTTPTILSDVLGRTSGGTSLALHRLERAGWLRRRPSPDDRRSVRVVLTAEGSALARRINDGLHEWERTLPLTGRDRIACERALAALIEATEASQGTT